MCTGPALARDGSRSCIEGLYGRPEARTASPATLAHLSQHRPGRCPLFQQVRCFLSRCGRCIDTTSSRAIESQMGNIPELSRSFMYLNDDFFLLQVRTCFFLETASVCQLFLSLLSQQTSRRD